MWKSFYSEIGELMIQESTNDTATRGYIERLERLRHLMTSSSLEMIAIVPGPTLQYLCGVSWHLSERPLIAFFPAQGDPAMIIPILEIPKIQDVAPFPIRFFIYTDVEGYVPAFEQACRGSQGCAGSALQGRDGPPGNIGIRQVAAQRHERDYRGTRAQPSRGVDTAIVSLRQC